MTLTTFATPPRVHQALAAFTDRFSGAVLEPGTPEYERTRRVWNGMVDKRPAVITRPWSTLDIQRAIAFAADHELTISVKGGGHNVTGLAVAEGGLMLDMSQMRSIMVDPIARTARVQGGATWADVDAITAAYGLATTGDAISSTGVAGLTLGGGVGWLVGKHGLAIDNLRSVELVTADSEVVRATADEHTDLFWALRGGGGNFGVVTELEFTLHPMTDVLAGAVIFSIGQARDVLAFYREFSRTAPDELTAYFQIMTDPDSGARVAVIPVCWSGDLAEGERALAPLATFGEPLAVTIDRMPYVTWQAANDDLFPHGRHSYWKGNLLWDLPDPVLNALLDASISPPIPGATVVIECYAGAMNRIASDATAYPHRSARYQLVILGATDDLTERDTAIAWARELHAATASFGLSTTFHNFNVLDGDDPSSRVAHGFGRNWDRLVAVKRRYDPTNLFRENHNITP